MIRRPPIGSRWRERRPYQDRIVTVVGYDEATGKVILTSNMSQVRTKARADRFSGSIERLHLPRRARRMTKPTPLPQVANHDFCAYCFKPLGAASYEARGRRYCTGDHAEADQRLQDAGRPPPHGPPTDHPQLDLDGLA